MKPSQPTLPGVTLWTEPQTVRGSELVQIIARAAAAGFKAHRTTVKQPAIYEVRFFRQQTNATR
jgi:hypothetical protein